MPSRSASFRHPRWIPATLALAVALLAGCDEHPVDGGPEEKPRERFVPLGVVEVTITGVDGETPTATAVTPNFAMTVPANGGGGGNGSIQLESAGSGSFTEGTRGVDGVRYVYATFRVRNAQSNGTPYDTPRTNLTFVAVQTAGTFAGTPVSLMRRFDGTNADPSIATSVIPTGALGLSDSLRLRSLYPDVLQVFTEAEAGAIPVPAGVTGVFPYGFVARHRENPNSRTLAANPGTNQFDGVVTIAFRVPLQAHDPSTTNGATKDVFTLSVQLVAMDDSETRMTESIEEQSDEGRAAAMARATALGATTVTVLAGSPAADPAVPDYPGQRQICAVRTAGTPGASMATITSPGPFAYFSILNPGETLDWCAPYFRTGTPSRPATNVPYSVGVYAMDRYGNVRTAQTDVVTLAVASGPAFTPSAPAALTAGAGTATLTYHDYGMSGVRALGTRL
ncbi:MAG TPA: hypothetical protein VNP72_09210, partial [Longimicrobium sp.]|nr:hypothetical protein [Longimicrobium sp.]